MSIIRRIVVLLALVTSITVPAADLGREVVLANAMPEFWSVMEQRPSISTDELADRFVKQIVAAHADIYGPLIPVHLDMKQYLHDMEPLLPTMREIDEPLKRQIELTARELRSRLGSLADMTIYIGPSLWTSNGQVRISHDRPIVIFGPDVQAYVESTWPKEQPHFDFRAYVAHELFHAQHYASNEELRSLANDLFDADHMPPLYVNLWIEGLATCVSMTMDGDGSTERALMSQDLPSELPKHAAQIATEMLSKASSRDVEYARNYFWLNAERKDIPARSAYGIGALVASNALKHMQLRDAMQLKGESLRREVMRDLRAVSRQRTIDWNTVCVQ